MLKTSLSSTKAFTISGLKFFASLLGGFILSGVQVSGIASFADVSIAGALDLPWTAAVFTGSLIHSIIFGSVGKNMIKISAILMIMIIKLFIDEKRSAVFCGITTSVSIFLSGAAVSFMIGELVIKLVFYLFYGGAAGFLAYSIAVVTESITHRRAIDLTSTGGCAYAVVYTLMITSLCSVYLPAVDVGIIFGISVTLLAAYNYNGTGGALCGALTTCGAFLASQVTGMTIVLLPVAGLVTGSLKKRSPMITAFSFAVINFMLTVLTGVSYREPFYMLNIILGIMFFLITAPYFSDRWIITESSKEPMLQDILSKRLKFLSESIEAIRNESEKISQLLMKNSKKMQFAAECGSELCGTCIRRLNCWKNDRDLTIKGFRKLSRMVETADESFPFELNDCIRKKALRDAFERSAKERAVAAILEARFSESRRMLSEELKIIEELIGTAGERMDVRYSSSVSRIVKEKLSRFDIEAKNVIAYYNEENRLMIEIYFHLPCSDTYVTRIRDLVSDELRLPLSCSEPLYSENEMRLRLYESPRYSVRVYSASSSAREKQDNGDTSLAFNDGTGVSYVILSDGMGSGKEAAVSSRIVVRMFRKLISSGVNYGAAVRIINSIMLSKSSEESFATLDALRIDLDDLSATVIKSGASATLIRHNGGVMKISSSTFPIGIYESPEVSTHSFDLDEGDIIIMMSDGISENEYNFIKEMLMKTDDLKHIVDRISEKSQVFSPTDHRDDTTVIGVYVTSSEK